MTRPTQLAAVAATYDRTSAEISAGVTPSNYGYPPGDVRRYGATGNGTTDDTAAIQNALNASTIILFPAGYTFIVNGGLTGTVAGQQIIATGATIKLKNSASTKYTLYITANDVTVDGGTWDGNQANGNATGSTYNSFSIGVYADRCTVKNINSINTYGIGIKGLGNYLSFLNNRIRNTTNYGIFVDGNSGVDYYGNRAIGNTIDMSNGGTIGQGILFTAGPINVNFQIDWELADNNVIGPSGAGIADQAICLAVRGKEGICSNNVTRYGSMGFSEGGSGTIISGNHFLDMAGSYRYGIEPSGANTTITGNIVRGAYRGIMASGTLPFDNMVISGNQITAASGSYYGIYLQLTGTTGQNIVITGNNVNGYYPIYTQGDAKNLNICGNVLIGPDAAFGSGRGVYLDTPAANAYIFINGNVISNVQRPYSIYSSAATTFNYLFATNNNIALAGNSSNSNIWTAEGSAAIGTNVISAHNINCNNNGVLYNMLEQGTNLKLQWSGIGSPNGSIVASPGSVFLNTAGGAGTTLYIKESGSSTNTGWVGK